MSCPSCPTTTLCPNEFQEFVEQYEQCSIYLKKIKNASVLCQFIGNVIHTSIENINRILYKLFLLQLKSGHSTNATMIDLMKEMFNIQKLQNDYILSQVFGSWTIGNAISLCPTTCYKPCFEFHTPCCEEIMTLQISNPNLYFDNPLQILEQYYRTIQCILQHTVFISHSTHELFYIGTELGSFSYTVISVDTVTSTVILKLDADCNLDFGCFVFQNITGIHGEVGLIYKQGVALQCDEDGNTIITFSLLPANAEWFFNLTVEYFQSLTDPSSVDVYTINSQLDLQNYIPFTLALEEVRALITDICHIEGKYRMKQLKTELPPTSFYTIKCILYLPNCKLMEIIQCLTDFYKTIQSKYWCYYIQNEMEQENAEYLIKCITIKIEWLKPLIKNTSKLCNLKLLI